MLRDQHKDLQVPVTWLESNDPSYILYTSGTTGIPKGVQRAVGGYAVAIASSMQHINGGQPGGVYFATADIGWVVGHAYIVYGPLIAAALKVPIIDNYWQTETGWPSMLPKTHSGKLLRRSIQAICEGRDPGNLTAIEDPMSLQLIKAAVSV